MILNRIVIGFVVQQFDTELNRYTNQQFIAEDGEDWETLEGTTVEKPDEITNDLNMEMVQPNYTVEQPPTAGLPRIDPLLAQPTSFEVGETVTVTPLEGPTELHLYEQIAHEFMGKVIGIRDDKYIQVRDQDGDVWDCEPVQVHHVK